MTKDVLVSVRGLQFADSEMRALSSDDEIDRIETICPGQYYYRNDTHFILYDELIEDFAEPVKNMIKVKDNEFILTKRGPVNVQMVFSEGKKTMTEYATPYGNILVALDTSEVKTEETDESIDIHIIYGLEANYQFIADCNIAINVKNASLKARL